ncbi:unnamed protein product, partial [Adineta steineri]
KAFLVKAKDEFSSKYDKPSQNTAKPEEFDRIRTLGTGKLVQQQQKLDLTEFFILRFVWTCYAC